MPIAEPVLRKTYVVTGVTGAVGAVVAEVLTRHGHRVRGLSRRAGASIDDPATLAAAFRDADGAFVMIPFDRTAADLHTNARRRSPRTRPRRHDRPHAPGRAPQWHQRASRLAGGKRRGCGHRRATVRPARHSRTGLPAGLLLYGKPSRFRISSTNSPVVPTPPCSDPISPPQ